MTEISTYYAASKNDGKAVVSIEKGVYVIDYYDNKGHHFFKEEYPDKTLGQVELLAEDWSLGYKELEVI